MDHALEDCIEELSTKNKLETTSKSKTPKSKTYSKVTYYIEEIIQTNINYCKKFDLNITELYKTLLITYWLPKIYKTLILTDTSSSIRH